MSPSRTTSPDAGLLHSVPHSGYKAGASAAGDETVSELRERSIRRSVECEEQNCQSDVFDRGHPVRPGLSCAG